MLVIFYSVIILAGNKFHDRVYAMKFYLEFKLVIVFTNSF